MNVGNETDKANAESESKIIAEVIANLLKDVCNVENTGNDSNAENRRGRDKRKTYTNEFKYQVILETSSDASLYDTYFAIWKINRDALEHAAA